MDESTQLQVFRELGSMDARIGNIEKDMSQVKTDVAKLLEIAAQQKGSKGTIAAWGSGGVGVGGLIVAAASWLGLGPSQPERRPEPVAIQAPVGQPMRAPVHNPGNGEEVG